jgi:hypothetical protein
MKVGLIRELDTVLCQNLSSASQTARWVARSTTGLEVASNIAGVVNAEIKIGIVSIDGDRHLLS